MRKILLTTLILGACAAKPPPAPIETCPVAPAYTPAFEQAAGQSLAALPPESPIVKMMEDYLTVRKELKECN
jgi:hypothetical protein